MRKHNNSVLRTLSFILALSCLLLLPSCFDNSGTLFDGTVLDERDAPEFDRFEILPEGIELRLSDDGSYYIIWDGTKCTAETVIIPEKHNGKPITEIARGAFLENNVLKKLTLPSDIVRIGVSAFANCDNLEYNVYGNAKYLGSTENPYAYLISLTDSSVESIEINEATRVIAGHAFFRNDDIVSLTLPDSVICVSERAFYGCGGLASLDLGEGVKYIDDGAFGQTAVTEIKIPDSTVRIGDGAFGNPSGIDSLEFGKSVEYIGAGAFPNLHFEVLEIPDSVTHLGSGAFSESEIKKLIIGDGLKVIEAFQYCASLTEIVFGDSVEYIAAGAFKGCSSLRKVELPKSLKGIHMFAFKDCENLEYSEYKNAKYLGSADSDFECLMSITKLRQFYDGDLVLHPDVRLIAYPDDDYTGSVIQHTNTVTMDGEGKHLRVIDNCVIDPETKTLIFGTNKSSIPNDGSVTAIGNYAFYGRVGVTELPLPDGLISIGDYAFCACEKLRSTKFNAELESIGDYAFAYSDEYRSPKFPEGLKRIGNHAFESCNKIGEIYIPGSVEKIGIEAFSHCYGAYKITVGEGVTRLSHCLFDDCNKVTEIFLPSTLKVIDEGAFRQLYSLKHITLPEGLLYVEDRAFEYCQTVTSIDLPESLRGIGMNAFRGCRLIDKINIKAGLCEIGSDAFSWFSENVQISYEGTVEMWKKIDNHDNLIRGCDCLTVSCIDGTVILYPDEAPKSSMLD